jgi:hypothetical protein
MAFTAFPDTATIELDGMSRLFPFDDYQVPRIPKNERLSSEMAVEAIRASLDKGGIDYRLHWAKYGWLSSDDRYNKVRRDYGPAADASSPMTRWRATRDKLLGSEGRRVFWNRALLDYGLLEPR